MVTKWSELRERVPAVNDLLEAPPLRALTVRWNRSIVAAGVRSFVQELKVDVERRRVEGHFPSLTELAARAAKHVVRMQQPSLRPGINATGQLLGTEWAGRPLADDALQQMVSFGHGYVAAERTAGDVNGAAAALCRLTGAAGATVVHSYSGAIWLALAALAGGKEVLVGRAEVADVEPSCSLAELATSAGAILREVGAVNRASSADYEAAASDHSAAIVKHAPETHCLIGETQTVDLEELVAVARDRELVLVDALGSAPLVDGLPAVERSLPTATASLAAGANLVLLRGDGLVGGPRAGLLLGDRDLIHRIERHPLFAAWRADAITLAALEATLELYDDRQRLQQAVPLFQLLSTSVENLRHRAERLAPQLAQAAEVTSAEPVSCESQIGVVAGNTFALPSYGVGLLCADVDALDARLRSESRPIIGRRENGRLLLDLRSVFPRDDRWLVTVVAGSETPANVEESAQPVGDA